MALFRKRRIPIESYDEEELRPSWISTHLPVVFIGIGVLVIAAVVVIITLLLSANSPVAKFSSSLSKNLDSGCDFHIEAKQNNEAVLKYDGSVCVSSQPQGVTLVYDADMGSYTYTGVTLTQAGTSFSGNYLSEHWTVTDANTRVQDFMDFYLDFKNRVFDSNSFLRFLGLTDKYSSIEFSSLMEKLLPRFSSENDLTHMKVDSAADGSVTYTYTVELYAFLVTIRDEGASIFQRSSDYDAFCEKIALNENRLESTKCSLSFTVLSNGCLKDLSLSMEEREASSSISISFSGFGEMSKSVPDSFYEAAGIVNPNIETQEATEASSLQTPSDTTAQGTTQETAETQAQTETQAQAEAQTEAPSAGEEPEQEE